MNKLVVFNKELFRFNRLIIIKTIAERNKRIKELTDYKRDIDKLKKVFNIR